MNPMSNDPGPASSPSPEAEREPNGGRASRVFWSPAKLVLPLSVAALFLLLWDVGVRL